MKIECPSCHLSGKVNEVELPDSGRELECPRCKHSFHVDKPKTSVGGRDLMNICPACQYSTFTDEMFAVCPKCGLVASSYREKIRKQQEMEQLQRDQETLTRSHRNPDLVTNRNGESEPEKPNIPQPVKLTGVACITVGVILFFYGISGLMNYYGKDWQAALSEPFVEPVSQTSIFFRMGFVPWLTTSYSIYFIAAAWFFLAQKSGARRDLIRSGWCGLAMVVIHEGAEFINWIRISSSSPSFSYIVTGIMNSLFWTVLWGAPVLALIWFLRSDRMVRELPDD
ncbi:MAG TPA: zinc-ribbon domain-containing protein [Geobacteraceae bacterium]|nr:zinc-ribbon domain-containing protein [Geobacteraceae bacterium]